MTQVTTDRDQATRWQALPEVADALFDSEGLRVDAWQEADRVQYVKQARHRSVFRVELPDGTFHVKHARAVNATDWMRHVFRASPARHEWDVATELTRRGFSTARPVAWQERRRLGVVHENWLVTETIPDARSLAEYLRTDCDQTVGSVVDAMARLIAGLHREGVIHHDFHPGNVLLRLSRSPIADPEVELFLIDLAKVTFTHTCDRETSWANLAMWDAGWRDLLSDRQRRQFFDAYLQQRPDLRGLDRQLAVRELDDASGAYYQRRGVRRDRRVWRNNRDFLSARRFGSTLHSVRGLAEADRDSLLNAPDGLLFSNLQRPVKLDHGVMAVEAPLTVDQQPVRVLYKRYRPKTVLKSLVAGPRASRASRSWFAGNALRIRSLATPRPIAVGRTRWPWYRTGSYLAVEWIEGSRNLHLHAWSQAECPLEDRLENARQCAERLGRLVGRMHALGITHGDLKGANVLIRDEETGPRLWLIDLDDVRIGSRRFTTQQRADLVRLATSMTAHPWVTRAVQCRFMKAYIRQFPPDTVDWKPLWKEVATGTERLVTRKKARGQQVL